MIALGIDPGTAICGYGFVEQVDGRLVAKNFGVITTNFRARMQDVSADRKIFEVI